MTALPKQIYGCDVTSIDGITVNIDASPLIIQMQTQMLKKAAEEHEKATGIPAVEWLRHLLNEVSIETKDNR